MNKNHKDIYFYIISVLIIVTIFIFLQPKISMRVFLFKKKYLWKDFKEKVLKENKIEAQSFWKFREFYCPGNFIFNKKGIKNKEFLKKFKDKNIDFNKLSKELIFLEYNCSNLYSIDALVDFNDISQVIKNINPEKKIYKNKNDYIYSQNKNKQMIIFIKPLDEMKKANGFFDYKEKDKELVKGKYWLNISLIQN